MGGVKIVWLVPLAPESSNLIFLGYFFGQLRSSVQERLLDFFCHFRKCFKVTKFLHVTFVIAD